MNIETLLKRIERLGASADMPDHVVAFIEHTDGTIEYEGRAITDAEREAIIAGLPNSKFPAYITVQIIKPRGDA